MEQNPPNKPCVFLGVRDKQVMLMALGILIVYMQKFSLSIAMVAMAEPNHDYPVVKYSLTQEGILTSMYYCGYLVSSIPASVVINKYGAGRVFTITCGMIGGLLSSCMPLLIIYVGFESFCVARLLTGVFQGFIQPSLGTFLSKWVVPHEREKFSWSFGCSAASFIVMSLLSGVLISSPGGWPALYYCFGILSLIWSCCSFKYMYETPSAHKYISKEEFDYIDYYMKKDTSTKRVKSHVPWASILASGPVWALIVSLTLNKWLDGILVNFLPIFFNGVYNTDAATSGYLTMLTAGLQVIFSFLFAYIGNRFTSRVSTNFSRKFWAFVGNIGLAIPLFICGFADVGLIPTVFFMSLGVGFSGGNYASLMTNPMDLTPNYSGNVYGFAYAIGIIGSIVSTSTIGFLIKDENELSQWQTTFVISGVAAGMAFFVFLLLGSTAVQPWNEPKDLKKNKSELEKI